MRDGWRLLTLNEVIEPQDRYFFNGLSQGYEFAEDLGKTVYQAMMACKCVPDCLAFRPITNYDPKFRMKLPLNKYHSEPSPLP